MFCNRLNSEQLCRNRLFEDSASNMVKTEVKVKSGNLPFLCSSFVSCFNKKCNPNFNDGLKEVFKCSNKNN